MALRRFFKLTFFVQCAALLGQWCVAAQESKPLPASPPVASGRPEKAVSSNRESTPPEIEDLQTLAARLLYHAGEAGCHETDCIVLVTNFVFPDGSTFSHGMQWADELSALFASEKNAIKVVDRTLFKDLLQRDGISAKLQNSEPAARWMGKQFNASVVLVGQARVIRDTIVEVSARFLNVNDNNLIGPSSEVDLQVTPSTQDFSPLTGLPTPPTLPPFPGTVNGEKAYPTPPIGASSPTCQYMPSPPMTEAAISADYSGTILAEGVVGTDGAVRAVRIIKGAPFGLSELAVKTMETWKCRPALLDGKAVAVVVPFEVNYRSTRQN